jgi:histidinol dehydrogenase
MIRFLKNRAIFAPKAGANADVSNTAKVVINAIRTDGDKAVRTYSEKFDKWSPASFKMAHADVEKAISAVPKSTINDIKEAQRNIRAFAEAQRKSITDFEVEIRPGVHLGQRNLPINSIGA